MAEYIDKALLLATCPHGVGDIIAKLPIADVAPVKHGHWQLYSPHTDTWECSRCGYQVIDESFRTSYCPNCGATRGGSLCQF